MAAAFPVTGGFFGYMGSLEDSDNQVSALRREEFAARKNAKISREAGEFNAAKQQSESTQIIGGATAQYGASGIEVDSGSVLNVLRQSYTNAELDRQQILYGAEMKALDYEGRANWAKYVGEKIKDNAQMNAFMALFSGGMKGASYMGGGGGGKTTPESGATGGGYGSAGGNVQDFSGYV